MPPESPDLSKAPPDQVYHGPPQVLIEQRSTFKCPMCGCIQLIFVTHSVITQCGKCGNIISAKFPEEEKEQEDE